MKDFLTGLYQVFVFTFIGVGFIFLINRFSNLIFGLSLSEEIKKGNQAAAIFGAGLLLMIGLLVGLIAK
jgi:uncharacterized membrane protein YjfL (UPF0719 family)